MRILYGAGNLEFSNIRLSKLLKNTKHDIKIAAHLSNHEYLNNIDWYLGVFRNKFKFINENNFSLILNDVKYWKPDLVISDFEFITSKIAELLNIPLISCSPFHLIDGVVWPWKGKFSFSKYNTLLKLFSHAKRKLIYSPFGLLKESYIKIKDDFEWVMPYNNNVKVEGISDIIDTKYNNEINFNYGDTETICRALLLGQKICVADISSDIESKLNAIFVEKLGVGIRVGDCRYNIDGLDNLLNKLHHNNINYDISNNYRFLHEVLDDYN